MIIHVKCGKPVGECQCFIPLNDDELEMQRGIAQGYDPPGDRMYYASNTIKRFIATIDDLKTQVHNLKAELDNFTEEERHG